MEAEVRKVLRRPKFARYGVTEGRIDEFLGGLLAHARRVEPSEPVSDCRDPKDNLILAVALAASAEVILSGDEDLLVLDPWRGIPVVAPAVFLERFG